MFCTLTEYDGNTFLSSNEMMEALEYSSREASPIIALSYSLAAMFALYMG